MGRCFYERSLERPMEMDGTTRHAADRELLRSLLDAQARQLHRGRRHAVFPCDCYGDVGTPRKSDGTEGGTRSGATLARPAVGPTGPTNVDARYTSPPTTASTRRAAGRPTGRPADTTIVANFTGADGGGSVRRNRPQCAETCSSWRKRRRSVANCTAASEILRSPLFRSRRPIKPLTKGSAS